MSNWAVLPVQASPLTVTPVTVTFRLQWQFYCPLKGSPYINNPGNSDIHSTYGDTFWPTVTLFGRPNTVTVSGEVCTGNGDTFQVCNLGGESHNRGKWWFPLLSFVTKKRESVAYQITVESGYSDALWDLLNFSRTVAGITKWFWVTIERHWIGLVVSISAFGSEGRRFESTKGYTPDRDMCASLLVRVTPHCKPSPG